MSILQGKWGIVTCLFLNLKKKKLNVMTLESQGRWKILVQLGGDKRKTRIPIIFWEKSMSNETKLYENLKKEAVYIAHWQDLRHSLIRKREKNKLGTSYKKKSKSTMVSQVETTYLADKKANQCAAQCCFSFSSFINLTEHFAGRIKAADRWSHPSRGIPSFLAVLYCLFFSWVPGHRASSCPCQDWGVYARTERCPVLYV